MHFTSRLLYSTIACSLSSLPAAAAAVAMKTSAATTMAGTQTTINNQLKAAMLPPPRCHCLRRHCAATAAKDALLPSSHCRFQADSLLRAAAALPPSSQSSLALLSGERGHTCMREHATGGARSAMHCHGFVPNWGLGMVVQSFIILS